MRAASHPRKAAAYLAAGEVLMQRTISIPALVVSAVGGLYTTGAGGGMGAGLTTTLTFDGWAGAASTTEPRPQNGKGTGGGNGGLGCGVGNIRICGAGVKDENGGTI